MPVKLRVISASQRPKKPAGTLVIGTKRRLGDTSAQDLLPTGGVGVWEAMLDRLSPGDIGAGTCTWIEGDPAHQLSVGATPAACSRHNSPARPHAVSNLVRAHAPRKGAVEIIVLMERAEDAVAAACAVARAYPEFSLKSARASKSREIRVLLLGPDGKAPKPTVRRKAQAAAEGVRYASALVDGPACEVDTDAMVAAAPLSDVVQQHRDIDDAARMDLVHDRGR